MILAGSAIRKRGHEGGGVEVLLFSPLEGRDPPSGDIAYSENLLAAPPPGVTYTTYAQAIDDGTLLVRGQRGGGSLVDRGLLGLRVLEMLCRRAGLMFREPVWFVTIEPGRYDVLHQHLFSVAQIGPRTPVVSSAGYPLDVRYREHDRWPSWRTRSATALEVLLAHVMRVHVPWLHHVSPAVSTGYTETFRKTFLGKGAPRMETAVLSTFLAALPGDQPTPDRSKQAAGRLVFVGRDFVRKGGPVAVAAFQLMRQYDPAVTLDVVTTAQSAQEVTPLDGLRIHRDLPHSEVLELLDKSDVMLAPTFSDCGAPYGVLEALRAGCGVVMPQSPWLDDRLVAPAAARVQALPAETAAGAVRLLELRRQGATHAQSCHRCWSDYFSEAAFHPQLKACYDQAQQHAGTLDNSSLTRRLGAPER